MALDKLTRVGTIIATRDVERLASFYVDRLGFAREAYFDDPPYAILSRNGTRLSLAEEGHPAGDLPDYTMTVAPDRARPHVMLVLEVEDCDTARAELESAGCTFISDTYRPPWGGARCFLADPDGNVIEIEELA